VPERNLTLVTLFVAGALTFVILLAAFLAALLLSQRRRIALEREHTKRILAAQEEERSRVARELHDDALQRLAVIRHELDEVARIAASDARHRLGGVGGELEDLAAVLRTAAHQLHPSVVEKAGLVRALGDLAAEFGRTAGLEVQLALPGADVAAAPAVGVAVYRIAQEALRNVVRHAGVAQADLALEAGPAGLTLRITDRGKGVDPSGSAADAGLGLIAMRQRAEALGGRLTLAAGPSGGTVVSAVFPPAVPS
jgi:two-component system NarL family sensor kinase